MATHIDNPNSPISSNTSDPHASDSMDRTDPSSNKSSSQNSSETPFYDQMFLHHSDPPSLKLATTLLSEHNYTRWKRSVEVSLLAKNKLGFVNGDCRRPLSDAKSIARWDQCNNMIISWLLHSVEREIAESVLYCKTAAQIWQELATRYGKTNRTNLFQIQKELSSISQGNSSITLYFTRLKKLWDEYMIAVEDKICSCGSNEVAVSILKDQQVIQFLVGLNESFSMVRSNILMMQPSPSLDNVYKLVLQDETQRGLHNMSTTDEEAVAMYSHNRNNSSQRQAYVRGQSPPYKPMFCDHCKARNHNIDKCWKLHGYPTAAAPGISFCDHCKVAGHVIAKCWKVHGYPAGHKLAATSFSQEQMNQLLALLPQTNKQSSSDGSHNAFLAVGLTKTEAFNSTFSSSNNNRPAMKLDVNVLRYLSKDDFRVLTAVELGMRNHEIVPAELVDRIARLKHGGTYKVLKNLLKHKLLHHDSSRYDGFRLTYLGYDFLAIKTLVNRGVFSSVGRQLGVGKESDIFEVANEDGTVMAMKLHRLGRVSFRAVKSKRNYLKHRSSYNWLYLSRLAALKEFAFMKALQEHEFSVPQAIDCNRHCVIMSLVPGYPLVQVKQLQNPDVVFETIIGLVVRLAEHGLIHCDFNEFNIIIDDDEKVTMIDFPQMVSVSHRNAQMYFDRDVECVFKFFRKRFNLTFHEQPDELDDTEIDADGRPCFSSISKDVGHLDRELAASGFTKKDQAEMDKFIEVEDDNDLGSSDGEYTEEELISGEKPSELNMQQESNTENFNSLSLLPDQDKKISIVEDQLVSTSDQSGDHETSDAVDTQEEGSDEEEEEDAELMKQLSKQRRRAAAAAIQGRSGKRTSRNSYKNKGGKSSKSSKIKELSSW